MIWMFRSDKASASSCDNYDEIIQYITEKENLRLAAKHPNFKNLNWSFTVYPPKHVAVLYAHSQEPSEAMKEAVEKNFSLIEICTGDYQKPLHIASTPSIDMDSLKKKWCFDYCRAHNYVFVECLSCPNDVVKPQYMPPSYPLAYNPPLRKDHQSSSTLIESFV